MLVLSRKTGEQIVVALGDQEVTIEVIKNQGKNVRLGVQAPPEVAVHRREVWDNIVAADQEADCTQSYDTQSSGLLAVSY